MRRPVRALAALSLLATAVGGLVVGLPADAASDCGGTLEDLGNGWVASLPRFSQGPAGVSLLAAPAYDSNLIYASNGTELVQSVDAGCGWKTVFRASQVTSPLPESVPEITALNVPSSANTSSYVYVGVTVKSATVSVPAIAVSRDRGASFTVEGSDQGLPALGEVQDVTANPTVPQIAYATVQTTAQPVFIRALYATSDAGESWVNRTGDGGQERAEQLIADPLAQTVVYAVREGAVVRSENGGQSFSSVTGDPGGPVDGLTAVPGGAGVRMGALRTDDASLVLSSDQGESWARTATSQPVLSLALMPIRDITAVSLKEQVQVLPGGGAPVVDVTPKAEGTVWDLRLSAPSPTGFAVIGIRNGTVARATLTNDLKLRRPPPGSLRPFTLLPIAGVAQFPSSLLPATRTVVLPAGGSTRVPYDVLVPRTPTPIDIMFLIDSTGSMASVIEQLRLQLQRIADVLDTAGYDLRVGVGNYRDYPEPYGVGSRGDWPYRRNREVGPVDDDLRAAIAGLRTGGGTTDGKASPLTALTQAATGRGDYLDDVEFVEPGQDARFRPGALKLAMVFADTAYHYGGQRVNPVRSYPGPDQESTIADLLRKDVRMVALLIGSVAPGPFRLIAEGTRSLAPSDGLDCDGDGKRDIAPEAPLVCRLGQDAPASASVNGVGTNTVATAGLPAAVVALAAGAPDVKPVSLSVTRGAQYARVVSAPRYRVNLRTDNELGYEVQLSCPRGPASEQAIALAARTPTRMLATGSVRLVCGGVAPAAAVLVVPPVRALAEANPPPPPAQAGPAPNPNPNPNPNPAPNVNLNAGMAQQDEEEQQLAFAESPDAQELEMSAWAFVGVAGLLTCTAGGLALRRRARTAPA